LSQRLLLLSRILAGIRAIDIRLILVAIVLFLLIVLLLKTLLLFPRGLLLGVLQLLPELVDQPLMLIEELLPLLECLLALHQLSPLLPLLILLISSLLNSLLVPGLLAPPALGNDVDPRLDDHAQEAHHYEHGYHQHNQESELLVLVVRLVRVVNPKAHKVESHHKEFS
jgi:hypothetical protein